MLQRHTALLAALALAPLAGPLPAQEEAPLHIEALAAGAHAAVQLPALWTHDANSVLIFDPEDPQGGSMVVDLPSRAGSARWWVERIQALSPGPVRYLVSTHWHSDHTQTNEVLKAAFPGLVMVGAENLRHEVPERAAAYLADQIARMPGAIVAGEDQLARGVDRHGNPLDAAGKERLAAALAAARERLAGWQQVTFLVPELTYPVPGDAATTEPVTLHLGTLAVELYPFRGHTRGDTVVYLPQRKTLITGDLLDVLPYGGHGYLGDWIAALETLQGFDFDILVPGHGGIYRGNSGREHLERILTMFRAIHAAVQEGTAASRSLEEIRSALDLKPHRQALAGDSQALQREFDTFVPETVERAYKLAVGEAD
jgi:glyoxylase-like metal-dependent hydrolase (beta-lactamase superfamily II)